MQHLNATVLIVRTQDTVFQLIYVIVLLITKWMRNRDDESITNGPSAFL